VEFLESARFRRSADGVFVECARADAAALYIACVSASVKAPHSHSPAHTLFFLFLIASMKVQTVLWFHNVTDRAGRTCVWQGVIERAVECLP